MHPLPQIFRPIDIAGVATFLASDDASFVTVSRSRLAFDIAAVSLDSSVPTPGAGPASASPWWEPSVRQAGLGSGWR